MNNVEKKRLFRNFHILFLFLLRSFCIFIYFFYGIIYSFCLFCLFIYSFFSFFLFFISVFCHSKVFKVMSIDNYLLLRKMFLFKFIIENALLSSKWNNLQIYLYRIFATVSIAFVTKITSFQYQNSTQKNKNKNK